MMSPFLLASTIVLTSMATAIAALLLLAAITGRKRRMRPHAPALRPEVEPTIFLFEETELIDASPPAMALLEKIAGDAGDWDRLLSYLVARFPMFLTQLGGLADQGAITLASESHPGLHLRAESVGEAVRIHLTDLDSEGQGVMIDSLSLRAQIEEIADLRETLSACPVPTWRTDREGTVLWANHAYLALATPADSDGDMVWPLPALFDPALPSAAQQRVKMTPPGSDRPHWFDCRMTRSEKTAIHYALPADNEVRAERSLREFVQTLAKTFAHLSVGLAVFDRHRQLALFNPALVDLTSLGPDFLSARPTLFDFLDQLREARMAPEIKNFGAWRQKMADLEKAAAEGNYEETWSIAGGLTYRVTGRPHPEGAVAFLFEDISAEMSLARRFRSELELNQSLLDTLDEAVVVISATGAMVATNSAYARLWGQDPSATLGTLHLRDAMAVWTAQSHPTPLWEDLRDFVEDSRDRAPWEGDITLNDGAPVHCRIAPLTGGATALRFARTTPDRTTVRHSHRSRDKETAVLN
ncbi:MAG: PAS-domain containing protein [Rhodobacteraceae bacterium]|nr:PAS-domain containing protein [Paracoccaceae bacterium]